jgi:hypothetical protein
MLLVERWNLLENPSWDSGNLDGWEQYNTTGSVSTTFSQFAVKGTRWGYLATNYSLEVGLAANSSVSFGNLNFIPVNPINDYQVLVNAYGGNSVTTIQLMVKYYSSGLVHLETQYNQYTGPFSGWTLLRGVSVPPLDAAFARFSIRVVTGSSSSLVRFDEAGMYSINMPLNRGNWTWNNTTGGYNMTVSKNMIRIYQFILHNRGSSGTHVYIEPASDTPAGTLVGATIGGNSTTTLVFNPPIYNIDRPYSTIPWRINNMIATGGLLVAVVYFNTMDYWTISDL